MMMRIRGLLFVILLGWGLNDASAREPMLVSEQKLNAFKEKIGFSEIVDAPTPDTGVVADWDGVLALLPSKDGGWELTSDEVTPMKPGLVRREWSFQRGEGVITVTVYVSSIGFAAVRELMLFDASATSLPFNPYVRGPEKLGQLSIRTPDATLQNVRWVFHNVCVKIREEEDELSVEPMARSIQAFMEKHVSQYVSQSLPRIDSVELSKNPVQVGGELVAKVIPKKGSGLKDLLIEFSAPVEELDLIRESEATSAFRALRPGTVDMEVKVSHSKSLLMSQTQLQVRIQPEK
jgi:hypothetical protein